MSVIVVVVVVVVFLGGGATVIVGRLLISYCASPNPFNPKPH